MAPTIVTRAGKPFLALGSPGGATIITTVLQILVDRVDLGMTLPRRSPIRARASGTR
jgi:gamma-glutamyltranspeptidase / glutathione hydrolase